MLRWPRPGPPRRLPPWRTLPLARPRQRRLRRPRRLPTKHRPLQRLGLPRPLIRRLSPRRPLRRTRPSPQPRLFLRLKPLNRLTSPFRRPNLHHYWRPFPCAADCRAPRAASRGRPAECRYRQQPPFRRHRPRLRRTVPHWLSQQSAPRALRHLPSQRLPTQRLLRKHPSPTRRRAPPRPRPPPARCPELQPVPRIRTAPGPRRFGCGKGCPGKPARTSGQLLPKSRPKCQPPNPSPRRRRPLQLTTLRARKHRLHPLHGHQQRCLLRTPLRVPLMRRFQQPRVHRLHPPQRPPLRPQPSRRTHPRLNRPLRVPPLSQTGRGCRTAG